MHEAPSLDDSGGAPQTMAGAGVDRDKDTIGPAAIPDSNTHDGGGDGKIVEQAVNSKGPGNSADKHQLGRNNKERLHSDNSPPPTGLFSAVVTAFTIESYQWLSEDPQDLTVALLMQISHQMRNEPSSSSPIEPFKASSSNVRINTFWFLSLIIALVDALFGLLCKQWLREHRRPIHTCTPEEALALHWLRRESLEVWHVPTFLAALPMLLELALFLFFAGLLELLWSRHIVPFSIAMGVVGFAALFYVGTTILPSVSIIRQALQVTPKLREGRTGKLYSSPVDFISTLPPMEFICPYKSPQAWVAFKAAQAISTISSVARVGIALSLWVIGIRPGEHFDVVWDKTRALYDTLDYLTDWPLVDLEIIQRSSARLVPHFYELQAFKWLVWELQDSPSMLPHLQNTLKTIPLHLVMPAVLDQWFFHPRRDWTTADIGAALRPNLPFAGVENHKTQYQRVWLDQPPKQIFNQLLHYNHILTNWRELKKNDWDCLIEVWKKIWKELKLSHSGAQIGPPFSFHMLDRILKDPRHKKFGLALLESCTEVSHHPQWFTHYHPLPHNLAQYIITMSNPPHRIYGSPAVTSSPFIRSQACLALIQQIHDNILANKTSLHSQEAYNWLEATDIIQHIHNLPIDHFSPLPGYFPIPLTKLGNLLWALSDEPSDSDFRFLCSFQKHWPNGNWYEKLDLIEILSKYINEFPALRALHNKRNTNTPLVTHRKGLEFIAFLYSRWEALNRKQQLPDVVIKAMQAVTEPWMKALEHVQAANGLSSHELKAVFTPMPVSRSESPFAHVTQGGNRSVVAHPAGGDEGRTVKVHFERLLRKLRVRDSSSDGAGTLSHGVAIEAVVSPSAEESGSHSRNGQAVPEQSVGGFDADNNV
ncbi:hypothetical protein V5O48_004546 [Marasmius crinis-equi]|uniref:DUF6535 domain-containing protein n=1 Tax=Marasmius crinis-equi TaxID=585013 RepID=A0ABR3FPQ4_9AGAR